MEAAYSRPVVQDGNPNTEVSYGGDCTLSCNDSYFDCYFPSGKMERQQTEMTAEINFFTPLSFN
jgi:hypothetical protein